MKKLKIVLIGPCKAGKSTIANFLSDAIEYVNEDYRPTKALRILEFEIKNDFIETEIELWDCSGDFKYENLWPVFTRGAHGVILVYTPEISNHSVELEKFYNFFISNAGSNLILAHSKDPDFDQTSINYDASYGRVEQIRINVLENGEEVTQIFEKFVGNVMNDSSDFDRDDFSLINMNF